MTNRSISRLMPFVLAGILLFLVGISCPPLAALHGGEEPAESRPEAGSPIRVEAEADIEPLFASIGDRRFVLLGESTHGTHEYYHWRDRISRRLIENKSFQFVAIEGDWDTILALNDYVKHRTPQGISARDAQRGITRWPQWMWANEEFAEFLDWLRAHNADRPESEQVGLYGLDMQDPTASMNTVVSWFEENDPETLEIVRNRYRRLLDTPDGFRRYVHELAAGAPRLQQDMARVVEWLREHLEASPDDKPLWAAKMSALAVKSAEAQHHAMLFAGPQSWNVRVQFMHDTFLRLSERHSENSRGIVWAHNTHVGDSAATDMALRGEVNIGRLLREHFGDDTVFILGFSTYRGTVLAGSQWGAPMQVMEIVPPREGSVEAILNTSIGANTLLLFDDPEIRREWSVPRPHRAIGVLYRPPNEAYVTTVLSQRYDAMFFLPETRHLTPTADIE